MCGIWIECYAIQSLRYFGIRFMDVCVYNCTSHGLYSSTAAHMQCGWMIVRAAQCCWFYAAPVQMYVVQLLVYGSDCSQRLRLRFNAKVMVPLMFSGIVTKRLIYYSCAFVLLPKGRQSFPHASWWNHSLQSRQNFRRKNRLILDCNARFYISGGFDSRVLTISNIWKMWQKLSVRLVQTSSRVIC